MEQGKSRRDREVLIILLVLFAMVVIVGVLHEQYSGQRPAVSSGLISVGYHVVSEVPVEISYNNATNGMDHEEAVGYWDKTIALPAGIMAYIAAQNDRDHGRVLVRIDCNGQEAQRSESNGAYAIANATAVCR